MITQPTQTSWVGPHGLTQRQIELWLREMAEMERWSSEMPPIRCRDRQRPSETRTEWTREECREFIGRDNYE